MRDFQYHRAGGRVPPVDREILSVSADGRFTLWRSVNAVAVGRFAGQLPDHDQERLARELAAVDDAAVPDQPGVPGARAEVLKYGDRTVRFSGSVPPPWGDLFEHLRELLDTLLVSPLAAVRLVVDAPGKAALEFAGTDPARVDLSTLRITATLLGGYYEQRGQWVDEPRGLQGRGVVEVGPGWRLDLPLDHGFAPGEDEVVQLTVTFTIFDGAVSIPVQVVHAPPVRAAPTG